MRLSERLETIIAMTAPCDSIADIGTDHGFVPIELVRRGIARTAFACDVRKGPLTRAEAHIRRAELLERICCRLGDGLLAIAPGEAEAVIIAGMGGTLMAEILENGAEILAGLSQMILSPHTDPALVRAKLCEAGFEITEERMVFEEGKYYVAFRAVPYAGNEAPSLTEEELLYGPCLLKERPQVFSDFLKAEEKKCLELLEKLSGKQETDGLRERIAETEEELFRIRRLLTL